MYSLNKSPRASIDYLSDVRLQQIWVDILSLIANLASFRSAWLATSPNLSSGDLDEKNADRVNDPDISAPIGLDAGLDEI